MNCKEVNTRIIAYIDRELDDSQRAQFAEHLSVCSKCKELVSRMQLVYGEIEVEKNEFSPNPFLGNKVWQKIQDSNSAERVPIVPLRKMSIAYIAAAGIFLGIALGTFFSSVLFDSSTDSTEQTWTQLADEYFPADIYEPYEDLVETSK